MKSLFPLLVAVLLCSCIRNNITPNGFVENSEAYVPVYADTVNPKPVSVEQSRATVNAGKIYVYRNYILQNELNEGIHIIDNTDPSHPVKKAFLSIPYNSEMAIRANHLYANSIDDLLVINVNDPMHPVVVNKIKKAFPLQNQQFPSEAGYFVCPDPAKGIIVAWKLEHVKEANCRR